MYELLLKNPSNVLKALILQIEWCNIFSEKKKKKYGPGDMLLEKARQIFAFISIISILFISVL